MKKRTIYIIILCLILMMTSCLYACGGSSAAEREEEAEEEQEQVKEKDEKGKKEDSSDKSGENPFKLIFGDHEEEETEEAAAEAATEVSAEPAAEEAAEEELPEEELPEAEPAAEAELTLEDFDSYEGGSRDELAGLFDTVFDSAEDSATMGPVSFLGHPGKIRFFFNGLFMDCASWTADAGSWEVYEEILAELRANGTEGAVEYPSDKKTEQTFSVNGRDFIAGFEEAEADTYAYVYTRYTPQPSEVAWTDVQAFSEGLAWIRYDNAGPKVSLIDTKGKVRFTLKEYPSYLSPYHEGTAVYTVDGTETDVLIDTEGNEIYRTEGSEDQTIKRERICGYANGVYLLVREESGISSATVKAALMAPDGTFIQEYTDQFDVETGYGGRGSSLSDYLYRKGLNWRGEGWYEAEGFLINFERRQLCNMSNLQIVADFTDAGELVTRDHMNYLNRYDVTINYIEGTDVGGAPAEMKNNLFWWCRLDYDSGKYVSGYYNSKVERIIAVDAYPENNTYGSPFEDGLALLEIGGADGKKYLTMIDETGSVLFDPVVISDYYPRMLNGFALIENEEEEFLLMDRTGAVVHSVSGDFPECDLAVSTQYGWSEYTPAEYDNAYGEGWLILTYRHDGEFYKRLYPVAEAAEAGEEVYDLGTLYPGQYTYEAAPENTAPEEKIQKEYVTIKGLTIEGKWKSIGSYGFGQAQPGAIVVFDGTHCNVFSPSDTYAFYEKGDHYVLETTSVLSTDTVSFTVRAVDDDHIDLIQGEYVTELERIE